jgi:hypothetical protein
MSIAETLRELAPVVGRSYGDGNWHSEYICDTLQWLADDGGDATRFLCSLGMRTGINAQREFLGFPEGPERQAVRYCWMMFAADIAEEWGV